MLMHAYCYRFNYLHKVKQNAVMGMPKPDSTAPRTPTGPVPMLIY